MRTWSATAGIPEVLASYNGPQFTSANFKDFGKHDRIKHTLVAPYHPQSNELEERGVQFLKTSTEKAGL